MNRLCPIQRTEDGDAYYCDGEACAWWLPIYQDCAIPALAKNIIAAGWER